VTVSELIDGKGREMTSLAALTVTLLLYSNLDAWAAIRREKREATRNGGRVATSFNARHGLMALACLGWASCEGLSASDLGLQRRGLWHSLGWGLALGAVASAIIRAFFAVPLVFNRAVTHPEVFILSRARLLGLLFVQLVIGTAFLEEVAFRGLLHAKLERLFGTRRALLLGSAVFAAWHAVIAAYNLRRTNLPRSVVPGLYAAVMALLFAIGWLLGLLRIATGHTGGGILAHWLMVANVLLALHRRR
jgi:membrane protease YdiL (CAAX protease family)